MSRTPRHPLGLIAVPFAALLVIIAALPWNVAAATPSDAVNRAWRRALAMGTYSYHTDVVQVVSPLPTLANVGLSSQTSRIYVAGTIDLPRRSLQMKLWEDAGSVVAQSGLELKIEDGVAQGRLAGGSWEPVDDVSGIFAPGQDLLGYLAAATNVREGAAEERVGIAFTPYTFDLNGPAFAAYLREKVEASLRQQGRMPPGARLAGLDQLSALSGSGELWVDAEGLPLRQVISLTMRESGRAEELRATITTDFRDFEASPLPQRVLHQLGLSSVRAAIAGSGLALLLFGLGALGLAALPRRRAYSVVACGVTALLIASPILSSPPVRAAGSTLPAREAAPDQADAPPPAEPAFDPTANPLARAEPALPPLAASNSSSSTTADDGRDSDGDSLTDATERQLGTQPQKADSDGDGLTDGIEVYELGTSPLKLDSDSDGLSDSDEVKGFRDRANNQWYLNPFAADSNGDGRIDGLECSLSSSLSCPDTDGDGKPDVFDDDDDGDGVPDSADTAPATYVVGARDANQRLGGLDGGRFDLRLNNYTVRQPLLVDVQLRPVNPTHLWYTLNVLDWPSDDRAGQIQRVNDDTLGASGKDANGDMRLVPMLEVTIPAADAAATLPLKAGVTSMPALPTWSSDPAKYAQQQNDWLASWLDQDKLRSFGLTARIKNQQRDLLVMAPLNLVYDKNGESPVAFNATLFYRPQSASFGAAHAVRMVWLLNGKMDSCSAAPAASSATGEEYNKRHYNGLPAEQRAKEPYKTWAKKTDGERYDTWCADATNWTTSNGLIHSYDDQWYLTGLDVREDHGVDTAVILQKAEQTPKSFPQHLWNLARNLDRTFIAGQAGITVQALKERFDSRSNQSVSAAKLWGVPRDALVVERQSFGDYTGVMSLGQSSIPNLLDTYFRSGTSAKVAYPALVILRAEQYRVASLEAGSSVVSQSGRTVTVNLSSANLPLVTTHAMNWVPYRLNSAGSWERTPIETYYQSLESTFQGLLSTLGGDYAATDNTLSGATALARSYQLSLIAGSGRIVSRNSQALPLFPEALSDSALALDGDTGRAIGNAVADIVTMNTQARSSGLVAIAPVTTSQSPLRALLEAVGGKLRNGTRSEILGLLNPAGMPSLGDLSGNRGLSSIAALAGLGAALGGTVSLVAGASSAELRAVKGAMDGIALASTFGFNSGAGVATLVNPTSWVKEAANAKWLKSMASSFSKIGNALTVIGWVLAVAVPVALFLINVIGNDVSVSSLEFTAALASTLANIIGGLIIMAISTIVPIGTIVAAVIGLIDAVIFALCKWVPALRDSENYYVKNWFCGGISGLIGNLAKFFIFVQDPLVDLGKDDRINPTNWKSDPKDSSGAMGAIQVGNYLDLSTTISTTLHAKYPNSPLSIPYFWMYTDGYVKDSVFKYVFTAEDEKEKESQTNQSALEFHERVELKYGSMASSWRKQDTDWYYANPLDMGLSRTFVGSQTASSGKLIQFTQAGLNWKPDLFLAEAYKVRTVECWGLMPFTPPVCYFRSKSDSNYLNVGSNFAFDVFPKSLDDFYALSDTGSGAFRLAWDAKFPALKDADGDGLRSKVVGGNDPNDNAADSDGDGLSDFYEVQHASSGFDPNRPDTDGDGLNDYDELRFGGDPLLQDSDGDGLLDKEELDGWEIVYAYDSSNRPIYTRVTADLNEPDTDNDGISDGREKVYGFNPRAYNEANLLTIVSTLDENDGLADGIVAPGREVFYSATIRNQLRNRYALGLFEVEFPASANNVDLQPRVYTLSPNTETTISGKVRISDLSTTQKIALVNRAGASIADLRSAANGRVVWLYFNESAGAKLFNDTSLLGNNAQCGAGGCPEAGVEGYSGRAVKFSGGARLEIPTSAGIGLDAFSVGLWVKPQPAGSLQTLVAKGSNFSLELPANSLNMQLKARSAGCQQNAVDRKSKGALVADEWNHVMVTFDGARFTIYLNGAVDSTADFSGNLCQQSAPVVIGQGGANLHLDDLSIYNRGLSSSDVLAFFRDPVLRLKFNRSIADSSAMRVPTAAGGQRKLLMPNGGALFNQKSWLTVGPSPALNLNSGSGQFTYSFLIYPVNTSGRWLNVLGRQSGDNDVQGYPSVYYNNNRLKVEFGSGSNRCTSDQTAPILIENYVQHVSIAFTGAQFIFYVNGKRVDAKPLNNACNGARPAAGNSFYVGRTEPRAWLSFEWMKIDDEADGWGNAELYFKLDGSRFWYKGDLDEGDKPRIDKSFVITDDNAHRWDLWEDDDVSDDHNIDYHFYAYDSFYGSYWNQAGETWYSRKSGSDGYGRVYWKLYNNNYIGALSDLRLYRYAFSDEDALLALYSQVHALALSFDEPPGASLFRDRSGNNLSAICAAPSCPDSGMPGRAGQSLRFGGDTLTVANHETLGGDGGLSIALWVRPDASGSTQTLLSKRARVNGTETGYSLGLEGGKLRAEIRSGDGMAMIALGSALPAGQWTHVAMTAATGGELVVYVNGSRAGATSLKDVASFGENAAALTVGAAEGGSAAFAGGIDELNVYAFTLSGDQVNTLIGMAPIAGLSLDEDLNATSFANTARPDRPGSCSSSACPKAGVKGQMREALVFDGADDGLHFAAANPARYTASLWVRPGEQRSKPQDLLAGLAGGRRDLELLLNTDLKVGFGVRKANCVDWAGTNSTRRLMREQWNHVAVTHDGSKLRLYINGTLDREFDSGDRCRSGDLDVWLGNTPGASQPFSGGLDEVQLFGATLSSDQIKALFDYQFAWYDVAVVHELTVDVDNPTVVPDILAGTVLPRGDRVVAAIAHDTTSEIARVEYSSGGAWRIAERDKGIWVFTVSPQSDGPLTITVRAYDTVGRRAEASRTVQVDGTAPSVAIGALPALQRAVPAAEQWAVPLSGSASDSGGRPVRVTVSVRDANGALVGKALEFASVSGAWSGDYRFSFPPNGAYKLEAAAVDAAGNRSASATTLRLDTTAPTGDVTVGTSVLAGTGAELPTLRGTATDLPLAYGQSLSLHFEEPGEAAVFYAGGPGQYRATCAAGDCPAYEAAGQIGAARSFDGAGDTLAVPYAAVEARPFTLSAWVRTGQENADTIFSGRLGGADTLQIAVTNGGDRLNVWADMGGWRAVGGGPLNEGVWNHVAVSSDGERIFTFVNGSLTYTYDEAPAPFSGFDTLWIGSLGGANDFLHGSLDEVQVYSRALDENEVRSPITALASGVRAVEVGLLHARDSEQLDTISWQPAVVADPDRTLVSWSYQIPAGVEGPHQVFLRVTDVEGNQTTVPNVWTGEIDTLAPRVTLDYVPIDEFSARVRCEVVDSFLSEDGLVCPVPQSEWLRDYQTAPWYLKTFSSVNSSGIAQPAPQRLTRVATGERTLTSPGTTVSACDIFGACTSYTVDPTAMAQALEGVSVVITPTVEQVFTTLDPIPVKVYSRADAGLASLSVTISGTPVYGRTWSAGEVEDTWAGSFTPPAEGLFPVATLLRDRNSVVITDTGQPRIYVDMTPPVVSLETTQISGLNTASSGSLTVSGLITEATALTQLQLRVDEGPWQDLALPVTPAAARPFTATVTLGAAGVEDGRTYALDVRAIDVAGREALTSAALLADLTPPTVGPLTTAYPQAGGTGTVAAGGTVTATLNPALTLHWEPASDPNGIAQYLAGWTSSPTLEEGLLTAYGPEATSHTAPATDATRRYAHFIAVDTFGNRAVRSFGPVYVDHGVTPAYINMDEYGAGQPYRGHTLDQCSLVGVDGRTASAGTHSSLPAQALYATWDSASLRLTWAGANWDSAGDLFVYLDTGPGGSEQLYDPYPQADDTIAMTMPKKGGATVGADFVVWVKDAEVAELLAWNGSAWEPVAGPWDHSFGFAGSLPMTDLRLPFATLGIADPAAAALNLLAVASDDGSLRTWASVPATNQLSSARVTGTSPIPPELSFGLTIRLRQALGWSGLPLGACPNGSLAAVAGAGAQAAAPLFTGADVTVGLAADAPTTIAAAIGDNQLVPASPAAEGVALAPLGDGDVVSYTLTLRNRGSGPAQGLSARVRAEGGLRLAGGELVLSAGDLPAGETATLSFQAAVDRTLAHADGYRWANLEVTVFDATGSADEGWIDQLTAAHQVDFDAPHYAAVEANLSALPPGAVTLRGVVADVSPVPTIDLEILAGGGGVTSVSCTDATPADGSWACPVNLGALADGVTLSVRARGTDAHGQTGAWGQWRSFVVDAQPAEVALDDGTALAVADGVVGPDEAALSGTVSDNGGIGAVLVCDGDSGECAAAELIAASDDTGVALTVDDEPAAAEPVAACPGGITRTFEVEQQLTVGTLTVGLLLADADHGAIEARLRSPGGTEVTLVQRGGTRSGRDYSVTFDDAAPLRERDDDSSHDLEQPFGARVAPFPGLLSAFAGEEAAGTWELSLCGDAGEYRRAQIVITPYALPAAKTATWRYRLPIPEGSDGVARSLRIYAVDGVGNSGTAGAVTLALKLDNVAPALTLREVAINAHGQVEVVGRGSDGGELRALRVMLVGEAGELVFTPLEVAPLLGAGGRSTALDPLLEQGSYTIAVEAQDAAGNTTRLEVGERSWHVDARPVRAYLPVIVVEPAAPPPPDDDDR